MGIAKASSSVTFPKGLTTIGERAFDRCTGLTSVTFPEGLTSIGKEAFDGCTGLTSVTFPEGLTTIGGGAFYECTGLTCITCLATDPPSILYSDAFELYTQITATLFVPTDAMDKYLHSNGWNGFVKIKGI